MLGCTNENFRLLVLVLLEQFVWSQTNNLGKRLQQLKLSGIIGLTCASSDTSNFDKIKKKQMEVLVFTTKTAGPFCVREIEMTRKRKMPERYYKL